MVFTYPSACQCLPGSNEWVLQPFAAPAQATNRCANGTNAGKAILALSLPPAAFIVTKTNNHPLLILINANAFTSPLVKLSFLASGPSPTPLCVLLTLRILSAQPFASPSLSVCPSICPSVCRSLFCHCGCCHRHCITRNSGNLAVSIVKRNLVHIS